MNGSYSKREMYLPEKDEAAVFKGDRHAGTLTREQRGSRFDYDPEYAGDETAASICFNMPVTTEPYRTEGVNLPPYFANLLPEGELLGRLSRKLKTSRDDLLSFLVELGASTVGDVWLRWSDEAEATTEPDIIDPSKVPFAEAYEALYGFEAKRLARVSIPGAQPKMSAARVNLPVKVAGMGECIVKLTQDDVFPGAAENEHFFMGMARRCGLETANTYLATDLTGKSALISERFDRRKKLRIHQEDACQLMNIYPADKYNVSVEEVMNAIKRATAAWPIAVQNALLLTAFSYVIGNGDHHAKNYSVVQTPAGDLRFSPAYDLLCTRIYGDPVMAITLNGKSDEWSRADFDELAGAMGLNRRGFASGLERMLGRLEREIPAVTQIPTDGNWAGIAEEMKHRVAMLRSSAAG